MATIKKYQWLEKLGKWPRLIVLLRGENSLAAWVRRYLEYGQMLGARKSTIRSRYYDLVMFLQWCDERALIKPEEIKKEHVARYQRYVFYYRKQDGLPLCVARQCAQVMQVKNLFSWLAKHNHIAYNPASEIEYPRYIRGQLRQPLSIEEVEKLLNLPDTKTVLGLRNRAMLEVMYSSGLRRSELIRLTLQDVDFNQGLVMVKEGKGGKDRLLPIGERALYWLQRYLEESRPELIKKTPLPYLFMSVFGNPLSNEYFSVVVRQYLKQANINKGGACHLLRHSMATQMLEGGADIRYIQEMLGHADLSTTQVYTHVAVGKLKEVHAKTHPFGQQKKTGDGSNETGE